MPQLHGENHPRSRLTVEDVAAIRRDYVPGRITYAALAKRYDTTAQNIGNVINGKTWQQRPQKPL